MERVREIGQYIAQKTGLYGPARSFYRNLFDAPGQKRRNSLRSFYSQIVSRGDLVFDIGANVGAYAEIFASIGTQVIAVEPLPENVLILENCENRKRIHLVQAAAGPQIGTGKIRRAKSKEMASMSREWIDASRESPRLKTIEHTWVDEIEVPITTLDALSQTYGVPDFIKIDVEGYEDCVLDGLSAQPRMISFEFNPEVMQIAQRCLEKPIFNRASECNFIVGEPDRFVLSDWTNIGSVLAEIVALHPNSFGDIFVRRPRA
jgi:FkbM family methyltransferase